MQYRHLGRSGLRVSAVSFGSWLTLGNTVDQASANKLVRRARDLGINLFDTADVYATGAGERTLGQAIADLHREHLVIATKCFFPMSEDPNDRGLSRKHVFESLHQSLERLETDYVDLYQCHRPDPETPLEETARAMDDLIRQGKTLYWGVSMWPAESIAAVVRICKEHGFAAPISNQPLYNLYEREIERDVFATCAELGLGQIVFSPLAQGVLTGKYRANHKPAPGTRAANDRVNQFLDRYLTPGRLQQAESFAALARRHELDPATLALAWCLAHPEVSSAIVGATSIEQLEQNAKAAELTLSPELRNEIERLFPVPR